MIEGAGFLGSVAALIGVIGVGKIAGFAGLAFIAAKIIKKEWDNHKARVEKKSKPKQQVKTISYDYKVGNKKQEVNYSQDKCLNNIYYPTPNNNYVYQNTTQSDTIATPSQNIDPYGYNSMSEYDKMTRWEEINTDTQAGRDAAERGQLLAVAAAEAQANGEGFYI